jgi:phage terminase small subunit
MPMLKNQRRETFCRMIIEAAKRGLPQTWAYEKAGYHADGHSAEVNASRLLNYAEIKARIAELGAPAVRKTRVSIESLLNELETTINDARGDGQHSVVVNALTLSAKLVGLLRDRVEVGGVGEFSACESTEDVVAALLSGQSLAEALAGLDTLRNEIERHAANHATIVPPNRLGHVLRAARPTRRWRCCDPADDNPA